MTLCSICGTILRYTPRGQDSHGYCLMCYFSELVRGGLASERERRIWGRMDRGWRGRDVEKKME